MPTYVGNRVWYDADGEGDQDFSEMGLAGVYVYLYATNNLSTPVDTQQTDSYGYYRFDISNYGTYQIKFGTLSGYTYTVQNQSRTNNDSNADSNGWIDAFTINANSPSDMTIDVGLIQGSAPPANSAPIAYNDSNTITEGSNYISGAVLSNDNDANGDTLSVNSIRTGSENGSGTNGSIGSTTLTGSYGSLAINSSGNYTYTLNNSNTSVIALNNNQTRNDTFTYQITDGKGGSDRAELSIVINGVTNTTPSSDYSANTSTTAQLSANSETTSSIETAQDIDWFRVSLTANQSYTIDLSGVVGAMSALGDTLIKGVYNSSGSLISGTTNDDSAGTRNSHVDFTPTTTGTYYIAAAAYSSYTGSYKLKLATSSISASDDYSANINTTGNIANNSNKTGSIETASDSDWFRLNLEANHQYKFNLDGSSVNAGTLSDPYLRGIYTSTGSLISGTANDDTNGLNSQVSYTPSSSGTYYIAAGGFGPKTGSYTLSAVDTSTSSSANLQAINLLDNNTNMDKLLSGIGSSSTDDATTQQSTSSVNTHGETLKYLASLYSRFLDNDAA